MLAETDSMAATMNAGSDQSDANREFHTQRQLALLNNGENPWGNGPSPAEALLTIARETISGDRSHRRVKITPTVPDTSEANKRTHGLVSTRNILFLCQCCNFVVYFFFPSRSDAFSSSNTTSEDHALMLPPGILSMDELKASSGNPQKQPAINNDNIINHSSDPSSNKSEKTSILLPPKPPGGPPPVWAFKKKLDAPLKV